MAKSKFLLMSVALLALSAVQLHAAKEFKLVARYSYSPDGQLQSVLTPVSDNGAEKTSYSRSYLSDGKIKVSVHKKNLEFNELAFDPGAKHRIGEGLHDYNEKFALCQVASKGDIAPGGLDKGVLVREYVEKAGRKLEETSMLGNKIEYKYNNKGQLVKILSGSEGASPDDSLSTSFSYDKYGRLAKTEDALGRVTDRVYDPEGRVAEMINPLDEKSFVNYNKHGRVASRSGAGAYPLSFEHNSFGEIIAYKDDNGSKTQFEYDNSGRIARRIWADGTPVSYSYNEKGLLSKKLEGKRTTVYSYDTMNRLAKIEISQSSNGGASSTRPLSSTTLLSYSSAGKLISIADESGKMEFTYDSFGRITSEKSEVGEIRYKYNSQGLLSNKECSFSHKDTKTPNFKTVYSYDNFDRITMISSPAGEYRYIYDSQGRIASFTFGSVKISSEYDKAGRLTAKNMNDNVLCSYDYDKLNRIVKSEVNGIKWQYGYDQLGQLVSANSSGLGNFEYNYDKIGNRLKGEIQLASREFLYNNLNQIANQGFEYDAYGNLVKTPDAKYKYDLQNRLVEVEKPGIVVKYSYDPFGQRIKSDEITTEHTKHTEFLMSAMIEQARVADDLIQFHTLGLDLASSLTATGGVGAVLASTTGSDTQNYLYDRTGNVIGTTDSTGTIKGKINYSPFGEIIGDKPDIPFTFSTKNTDSTGLSYYGFRDYSPKLGRWLSRDPIRGEVVGNSLYAMCSNDAVNQWDYLGMVEGFFRAEGPFNENLGDSDYGGVTPGLLYNECTCKCKSSTYQLSCTFTIIATIRMNYKNAKIWDGHYEEWKSPSRC